MNSCIFTCLVTDIRILKKYTTTKLYINPVVWLAGWLTNMKRPHYTCGNCLRGETRLWQGAHVSFFFLFIFFSWPLIPPYHHTNTITQCIFISLSHVFVFWLCHTVFVSDKSLKDTLDKVLLSGYFDRAQTHQNGTCEEEEEQEEQTVVAESKPGKQPSEPGNWLQMSGYTDQPWHYDHLPNIV